MAVEHVPLRRSTDPRKELRIASRNGSGAIIDGVAFGLLVAGLAWVPFWYGSNDLVAWGINALVFPGLTVLYEVSLIARGMPHPVAIRHVALQAVLFLSVLVWTVFQTLPLPGGDFASQIWATAAGAIGKPLAPTISVDPDLTRLAMLRLITAASVFWLSLQLCREAARAGLLVAAFGAIACGYSIYGLISLAIGGLPWLDIPSEGGKVSSTFVNYNSFATYAGMGLVATGGLVLRRYRSHLAGAVNWRSRAAVFIEATGQKGAAFLSGSFLILVALLSTGSRGGVAATAVGLIALGVLERRRDGGNVGRPLATIVFGLLVASASLYAFGDIFFAKLAETGISDSNRLAVYLLTLRSIGDAPLLGHGYGTFADVFPLYRDRSLDVQGIWKQAHNTYLELFQGLGLVFGSMLVLSVALSAWSCVRGAIERQTNALAPRVAASAAVLVGVHALIDFSLQIQAVTLTFMALLGAGVAQAKSSRLSLEG